MTTNMPTKNQNDQTNDRGADFFSSRLYVRLSDQTTATAQTTVTVTTSAIGPKALKSPKTTAKKVVARNRLASPNCGL